MEKTKTEPIAAAQQSDGQKSTTSIFQDVISNHYLRRLMSSSRMAFIAFELFLTELIKAEFLSINQLNDQCVVLLREEWPIVSISYFNNNNSF